MARAEYDYASYCCIFLILSSLLLLERIALESEEGNLNAYECFNSDDGLSQRTHKYNANRNDEFLYFNQHYCTHLSNGTRINKGQNIKHIYLNNERIVSKTNYNELYGNEKMYLNYGQRYLDPKYSIWHTSDPAINSYLDQTKEGEGGIYNVANLNLYHYAGNNPVKYTDPNGDEQVYFIYVYKKDNEKDQSMKASERNSINDDINYLERNGVSVKVIEAGTKEDIINALEDPEIEMLVTSGHGSSSGNIQTSDGGSFSPSELLDINVSETLNTVIFENCYQGGSNNNTDDNEKKWEEAFGESVDVVGWKGTTTVSETKSFNGLGWFDRQQRNLRDYCQDVVINSIKVE